MITKIGLRKEVVLLVECYTPCAPSAIGPVDLGDRAEPVAVFTPPTEDSIGDLRLPAEEENGDVTDEELVALATGSARVTKSSGFGRTRDQGSWDVDESLGIDWHVPTCITRLALKPGTKLINEIVEEQELLVVSGTICHVQEGAWLLEKPAVVQGLESQYC